ncbi:uncharacterized protein ARMOST_20900 [Armillaria ostoyae]|uniref:Uncharacterized protein n=1 Tax=Armillaria ostoyae TaxID=47428 RepID=A0A284S8P6_ARMOS|nr:uncharacterized protein ARMOST_20900 [Armillaria ostoyae]
MEVSVALAPSTQPKDAGQGGVVKSDGARAHDEDGRWGEHDLKAVIALGVADVVEVCTLVGFPIVDHHLGGIVIEYYDITVEGDWAEVIVDGMNFVQDPVVMQT